MRSECYSVSS